MKAMVNRVPIGPSDCDRGMYVWAQNPMRSVAKDGRHRNCAIDHRGLGQWTRVWKSQWAHVPGSPAMRGWNEEPTRATLFGS